jgi:hypothetical protein
MAKMLSMALDDVLRKTGAEQFDFFHHGARVLVLDLHSIPRTSTNGPAWNG